MCRVCGYLNSLDASMDSDYMRAYLAETLDAIEPSDPTRYAGLGECFYRKLKPACVLWTILSW